MNLNSNPKKLMNKKKLFDIQKLVEGNFQNVKFKMNSKVDKSFYDSIFKTMYISNLCINEMLSILKEFNLSDHTKILKKIYISQQYLIKNTIQNFHIKIEKEKKEIEKKINKKNEIKVKLGIRKKFKNNNYVYKEKKDSIDEDEKIEERDKRAKELYIEIEKGKELRLENIGDPYILFNLNKLLADDILENNKKSGKIFDDFLENSNKVLLIR